MNDQKYYVSEELRELWPYGHSTIGAVTFESAAYVARYITKKMTGPLAESHYEIADPLTGEIHGRKPEYITMSRRPGIGKGWWDKYKADVYPHDFVVLRGKKMRPPRFYDGQLEKNSGKDYSLVKAGRQNLGKKCAADNVHSRLLVKEQIKLTQFKQLKRSYESDK